MKKDYTRQRKHTVSTTNFRPYEGQLERIKEIARVRGCSMNLVICDALQEYLKKHGVQNGAKTRTVKKKS